MTLASKIVNFLGFELAWLAAIYGGASGWAWLGSLPALVVVSVHLVWSGGLWMREAMLIIAVAVLGIAIETGFMASNLLLYEGTVPGQVLPPVWIMALWLAFGTLPTASLGWLRGRWGLQALLGFIAGPLSYWGGVKMGAATIPAETTGALFWIGLAWALAMPAIFLLAEEITQHPRRLPSS